MTAPISRIPSSSIAPTGETTTTTQQAPTQEFFDNLGWTPKSQQIRQHDCSPTQPVSLQGLLKSWGLPSTMPWQEIARSAGLAHEAVAPSRDERGEMLVANFFNQTQLKPDPTVLPIIHAGAVHIAAASQRSALEGFSPVITGSLSDGQKDPGMSETFFSSDAYGVLIGAAKNYETRGTPPDEAAPFILVSDSHWATYKQLLPSADDLKLRGITRVVVGLENEDKGIRSLDEMLELGQPGQKILASRLKSYQDEGIVVELHGLDESRGEHPTTLPRRIMWESGDLLSLEQLRALQPEATNALFDRYRMKFQDAGSSFGAQRDRIEKARQEALEGRW